jgi:glycine oxidase
VSRTPDVVVVGGGVIGASCAWHLARAGRGVRLIERGERGGEAWRASAGMLTAQVEVAAEDGLFELGIAGREFYREQAGPLRETTGIDIGFTESGILEIAATEAEVELLKGRVAWQRQHGHPCEWLDASEVKRDWPWIGSPLGGQLAAHDGAVDPVRLVEALRADAVRTGVEIVTDAITALSRSNGRVTGVQGREWHPADHVVLAAGAWSGRIANLPRPISVEPVRGQLVAFPWPAHAKPAILFGHGGYFLHRGQEGIAGSTIEHAGFSSEVTEAGIAAIRRRAEALIPALANLREVRAWAGLRPGTPDGLPIVGREPALEGLWYATGHGRKGILLAGVTGRLIADQLTGEATFEEAALLRPERFWNW